MLTDLLGGQIQAAFDNLSASIEHIRAGKLRALAVTTRSRSPALPNIPTLGEFLPGFEANAWIAMGAPKNTPAAIIDKLNREINAGLADPKIAARLTDLGGTALTVSPVDLDKLVVEENRQMGQTGPSGQHQAAVIRVPFGECPPTAADIGERTGVGSPGRRRRRRLCS